MKKIKKRNINFYFISIILILVLLTTTIIISFAKYVLSDKFEHNINAEKFYFTSNLLNAEGKENKYYDWDFSSEYSIKFKVSNYEDQLRINGEEIKYKIEIPDLDVETKIYINGVQKSQNTLPANTEKDDEIEIKINPNGVLLDDFEMEVKVISEEPYEKELVGTFIVEKAHEQDSYILNLVDNTSKDYSTLEIKTNSYVGFLRVEYDKTKVIPDVNTAILENSEKHDGYIIINAKANSNYEIQFIKKNEGTVMTLGTDINVL